MLSLLTPPALTGRVSSGLLILRVVLGFAFVQYGLLKAAHPVGWAASIGLPALPAAIQVLVVVAELGGGLLLLFGALTPVAGLLIAFDMLGAVLTFAMPHGGMIWISATPRLTVEKNLIYGAAAVTLILTGPGAYSIDAWIAQRTRMGRDGLARGLSSSATS
jgi:putative oxidoreductase